MTQGSKGGRPTREQASLKRRDLNERQRAFVLWSATPVAEREFQTKREFAAALGVSEQVLWKWSKDPRVVEAVRFVTLQNASSPDKIRRVLDMVFEQAMEKKDVRMAEIWMKASGVMGQFGRAVDIGDIVEDLEADMSITALSDDELQRIRDLAIEADPVVAALDAATGGV